MKILNETDYDGRAMRRLITAAHNEWARTEGHRLRRWKYTTFKVVYSRHADCSGWAYLDGAHSRLRVHRDGVRVARFLNVAWHEIGHLYGYRHGQYGPWPPSDRLAAMLKAAGFGPNDHLPLKASATKKKEPPTPTERQIERAENAAAKLKEWDSKHRRAANRVKHWRKKVRYYERALAKKGIEFDGGDR